MSKLILIDAFSIGYRGYSVNYSIGISMLYNALNTSGVECQVLKRPNEPREDYASWVRLIAHKIMMSNPRVVAISVRCDTFPMAMDLIEVLKKEYNSDLIIVLGGAHASICFESIMKASESVDYIIIGEGETTLPNLVKAIYNKDDVSKIKGIVYRDNKRIVHTAKAEYAELKDCNINQYKLILDNYSNERSWFPIEAGRGCQYNCSFCCTTKMWRRVFRLYNADTVANTLIHIYNIYNIRRFQFIHDNILSSKDVILFLDTLSQKLKPYPIKWECSARIDNISDENTKLLKKAKCCSIYFGFETGSPKMQKVYKKNLDLRMLDSKIAILNKYGMGFIASFILGHPDEGLEDISLTLSLAVRLRSEKNCQTIQLHNLSFINGSDIYDKYKNDLVFDGKHPDRVISVFDEPIYTKINKDIYSYYFSYSKYTDEINSVLGKSDQYAAIINKYSKSINYIQMIVGTDSIIEILDAYANYYVGRRRDAIEDYINGKKLSTEEARQVSNIIDFEELLHKRGAYQHKLVGGE